MEFIVDPKIKLLINDIRISKGLSKNKLSQISGVGRSTITEIETTDRMPNIFTLVKLAYALNCKLDDLVEISKW